MLRILININNEREGEGEDDTYSGIPSGGRTTDNMLSINLYFKIRSVTVVDVKDGEAFTSTSHGLRLLSIMIS